MRGTRNETLLGLATSLLPSLFFFLIFVWKDFAIFFALSDFPCTINHCGLIFRSCSVALVIVPNMDSDKDLVNGLIENSRLLVYACE
mgnify:CR=1